MSAFGKRAAAEPLEAYLTLSNNLGLPEVRKL